MKTIKDMYDVNGRIAWMNRQKTIYVLDNLNIAVERGFFNRIYVGIKLVVLDLIRRITSK